MFTRQALTVSMHAHISHFRREHTRTRTLYTPLTRAHSPSAPRTDSLKFTVQVLPEELNPHAATPSRQLMASLPQRDLYLSSPLPHVLSSVRLRACTAVLFGCSREEGGSDAYGVVGPLAGCFVPTARSCSAQSGRPSQVPPLNHHGSLRSTRPPAAHVVLKMDVIYVYVRFRARRGDSGGYVPTDPYRTLLQYYGY